MAIELEMQPAGRASFDDNTSTPLLDYAWSFDSKPGTSTASLDFATSSMPTFKADVAGTYTLALVVTDEAGLPSDPAFVEISSDNLAPTADATVNFSLAIIGDTATFDGTDSTDPEMDPLTFSWSITAAPAGSTATLEEVPENPNPEMRTLTPDVEGNL